MTGGLTPDEQAALDRLVELRDSRRRDDVEELELLAYLDRSGVTDRQFGQTTAVWYAQMAGIPLASARRRLNTSRRLLHLPATAAAFRECRISFDHAATLAKAAVPRVLPAVQPHEAAMVDAASLGPFDIWAAKIKDLIKTLDQDGGYDPHRDEDANRLSMRRDDDGVLHGEFTLVGDAAAIVEERLNAAADHKWNLHRADREACPDLPMPGRGRLLAEGLVDTCHRAASAPNGTKPSAPLVTLRMSTDEPGVATTRSGARLSGAALDRLLGDARYRPLVETAEGVPLWLGTEVRYATAEQREVCETRDGGCVFPGCTQPARWAHLHHAQPAGLGGPTDPENLVHLCPHHHGVIHRNGWVIWPECHDDGSHTGGFIIRTPGGRRIRAQRHGQRPPGDPPQDAPAPPWAYRLPGFRHYEALGMTI